MAGQKSRRLPVYNAEPESDIFDGSPRANVKHEFAARLQRALNQKGWSPAEFVRRVRERIPASIRFEADTVSAYLRAKSLPTDVRLSAMADVLGISKMDLLPTRGRVFHRDQAISAQIKMLGDGTAWVYLNPHMPVGKAKRIMDILSEDA
jgi:transcriptional regulator with XRE-family HTH domain